MPDELEELKVRAARYKMGGMRDSMVVHDLDRAIAIAEKEHVEWAAWMGDREKVMERMKDWAERLERLEQERDEARAESARLTDRLDENYVITIEEELEEARTELSAYREEAMGGESVWGLLLQARAAVLALRDAYIDQCAMNPNPQLLADTESYEQYRPKEEHGEKQ